MKNYKIIYFYFPIIITIIIVNTEDLKKIFGLGHGIADLLPILCFFSFIICIFYLNSLKRKKIYAILIHCLLYFIISFYISNELYKDYKYLGLERDMYEILSMFYFPIFLIIQLIKIV